MASQGTWSSLVTPRKAGLALAALLLWLLGWDLWAVALDGRYSLGVDCLTLRAIIWILDQLPTMGLRGLLVSKDPLSTALAALMMQVVDDPPQAVKALSVMVHGVLVLQCFDLGRRLAGHRVAGLWAALLCGTFPMVFGWARMDFSDFLVACPTLAALQLMARSDLTRSGQALLLGLVLAAGSLIKLTFPIYVIVPGLVFIALYLRNRRTLLRLLVLGGPPLALILLWVLPGFRGLRYLFLSSISNAPESTLEKVGLYLSLPGAPLLLGAALPSAVLLWLRYRPGRPLLLLLLSSMVGAALFLSLLFDYSARYSIAIFPVAAVVVAGGLHHLQQRLPVAVRPVAAVTLVCLVLGTFVWLNLAKPRKGIDRENHSGVLSPDRRDYDGLGRALSWVQENDQEMLLLADSPITFERLVVPTLIWRYRGLGARSMPLAEAIVQLERGRDVVLLEVREMGSVSTRGWGRGTLALGADKPEVPTDMMTRFRWLQDQDRRKRLGATQDAYRLIYRVLLILARPPSEALRTPLRPGWREAGAALPGPA